MELENFKGSSKPVCKATLPGFRFYPTDEELVGFYLRRKVEKKPLKIELIKQIDIYKHDPWDLPKVSNFGDEEGYFFCMRGRKYRNSIRPNRVTGSGFWKATGIDKPIYKSQEPHERIGLKKSLVYYLGSAGKGKKTDWMMHEFRLPPPTVKNSNNKGNLLVAQNRNITEEAEVWTLCRIFKRTPSSRRYMPDAKNIACIKKSPADASSKACSWESEHGERCLSFGDSFEEKNNDRKPSLIGISHSQSHNIDNLHQQAAMATTTTYPTFWNFNNGDDVLLSGNWDELTMFFQGPGSF
ncbi:hypothetical protein MLD38_020063 [Melastoma candidum]|uniref:Uncharacterized protein n=1 Tax=Melastoma candidum TaxID=119954 RepID=A0ACB9QC53_9MYRT|nr:hypothetical protein MLD38_020063 [Melastoma candidum]